MEEHNPSSHGGSSLKHFWETHKRIILISSGVVLGILLIVIGAYAALRNGKDIEVDDVVHGELPLGGDREHVPVSGLSGLACEHHDRRPIGVMLAGDPINRPVSGFAKADIVWELPALVSNVTRLLAVYQCNEPEEIGSIRSARHDYLFLGAGIDAIVAHWGGSYHALNRIRVGEFQTINAIQNPHNAFYRKPEIPRPYNGFSSYERLWNALERLGYRTTTEFEGYDFKDDVSEHERPAGGTLTVGWPGAFGVRYEYNPETNRYERYWGNQRQVDGEDGALVAPSSVVVVRATNRSAPGPGGYNDVGIEGEGDVTIYQDGRYITGTWRKDPNDKHSPMEFFNEDGDRIRFTRGQVWVMAVDHNISVNWEPIEAHQEEVEES